MSPTQRKQDAPFIPEDRTRRRRNKRTVNKRDAATAKKRRLSRRFVIVAAVIAVVLAVGIGVMSWNQWFRYDDTADIQGTWQVEGSDVAFTFTEDEMVMTPEVSYTYELDTFQKTITFAFKDHQGQGTYAFSPERTTLVITETSPDTDEALVTTLVKQ